MTKSPFPWPSLQHGALLWLLLALCAWLYWPGLSGSFYLDDISNLAGLERIEWLGEIKQRASFALEGVASTLGRPVPLFSFALQAEAWPNHPFTFKRVNLLIHLTNGALLFWLALKLSRTLENSDARAAGMALVATAAWLLHPIQVSTVLYVVQRMAELSALFTLAGLVLYVKGREECLAGNEKRGIAFMFAAITFFGTLATLSKENGALLPLFALLADSTLLAHRKDWGLCAITRRTLTIAPPLMLGIYLAWRLPAFVAGYEERPYSMLERLATQGHVMLEYLLKLFAPSPGDFTLHHDDFPVTHQLLTDPRAMLGASIVVALTAFALALRKRLPHISFGILFFYAGHLLESTLLPLDLYYEHRNYLPSIGLALAFGWTAVHLCTRIKSAPLRKTAQGGVAGILVLLSLITVGETRLWGDPIRAALTWSEENPHSSRALSDAATMAQLLGRFDLALAYYRKILALTPDDAGAYVVWLDMACRSDTIPPPDAGQLEDAVRHSRKNFAILGALNSIILDKEKGICPRISYDLLERLFMAALHNPAMKNQKPDFLQVYAMSEAARGAYAKALALGDASSTLRPDIRVTLQQIRWAALGGNWERARRYLDRAIELCSTNWKARFIYADLLDEWRHVIDSQLDATNRSEHP